jgi:hypothetical protein
VVVRRLEVMVVMAFGHVKGVVVVAVPFVPVVYLIKKHVSKFTKRERKKTYCPNDGKPSFGPSSRAFGCVRSLVVLAVHVVYSVGNC